MPTPHCHCLAKIVACFACLAIICHHRVKVVRGSTTDAEWIVGAEIWKYFEGGGSQTCCWASHLVLVAWVPICAKYFEKGKYFEKWLFLIHDEIF